MRRLFLAAPILAALVAGTAVAPARADSYRDTNIPFYVETPDGFTIRLGVREGYDLVLHIKPVGDFPAIVDGTSLCGIYFSAVRSAETQQRLNSRWKDEAVQAQVRRAFADIMQVKSTETFALRDEKAGDVVGLELVGPSRDDPSAVVMMSLVDTPRGQVQVNCVLRSDQATKALYAVRPIRDSIKLPR
ncbi:hypothetical protein [Reyranella soli]|jgi:hypothetical protein|uniref:Chalcone isomerase domain-containing protein n=1 Tax=Reyranella soli TaxID=1230389 RepID=A0A512NRM5_9HYPH|nr:hypothetical protein [Reyranella soli]GEP61608.1 hypothetical protein RSO01_87740 [Reyranella soli]